MLFLIPVFVWVDKHAWILGGKKENSFVVIGKWTAVAVSSLKQPLELQICLSILFLGTDKCTICNPM